MRFIDRLRDERGMSLLELMVAAMICAVGIIATIGVLDTSREMSVEAEFREAMAHQAEREVEQMLELPWTEFAHDTSIPAASGDATNPANRVVGSNYKYDTKNGTLTEPLLALTTGEVSPTSDTWEDNQTPTRIKGRVYRFVT